MDHAKELRRLADRGFCNKDGYSDNGKMLNKVADEIDRLKEIEKASKADTAAE